MIEHVRAGVMVHAADTRILLANGEACAILGLSADRIIGRAAIDPSWSFPREDGTPMPAEEHPVNRVLAKRRPLADLVIGVDRPGTGDRAWIVVNAFPDIDAGGEVRQVVVTFVDITERRSVERQLLHAQKLEAVGRLASGVAHDFNMSGYAGDEIERSGIAAPEVRFLQKPFDLAVLAREVSAALS